MSELRKPTEATVDYNFYSCENAGSRDGTFETGRLEPIAVDDNDAGDEYTMPNFPSPARLRRERHSAMAKVYRVPRQRRTERSSHLRDCDAKMDWEQENGSHKRTRIKRKSKRESKREKHKEKVAELKENQHRGREEYIRKPFQQPPPWKDVSGLQPTSSLSCATSPEISQQNLDATSAPATGGAQMDRNNLD
jgi:hypothetical protein